MKRKVIAWIIVITFFSTIFFLINISASNSLIQYTISVKAIQEYNDNIDNQNLILPNEFGYKTKRFFENTRLFFTFSHEGRIKYELGLADKRIAEIKLLIDQNADKKYIDTSISKYKSLILDVDGILDLLNREGYDNTQLEKNVKDSVTKHEVVINLMKSNSNYISELDEIETFIKDSNLIDSSNVNKLTDDVKEYLDNKKNKESVVEDTPEDETEPGNTQDDEDNRIQNQTSSSTNTTSNTLSGNQTEPLTNQTSNNTNTTSGNQTSGNQTSSSLCKDSDGKDFYIKGFVSDKYSGSTQITDQCIIFTSQTSAGWQYVDSCSITDIRCSVREGFCDNSDHYHFEEYECPGSCSDGACLAVTSCIESDSGENYNIRGKIASQDGNYYYDYCSDNNNLVEYYCSGNSVLTKNYVCGSGCSNGACISDNPLALYITKLYNMSSDYYQGAIGLYVKYGDGIYDNIYLGFIPVNGNFFRPFLSNNVNNNLRGAVYLSVDKVASATIEEQTITFTSDIGINKAYLPQIGSTQFTSIRFYVKKDGSTYWALRNHGMSGSFQSEFMNTSEAFQPIHLARSAPS